MIFLLLLLCRELKDQEHVTKLAQKMKEDEEVKKALRIQDEIMAKKLHEAEEKRCGS